jgi:RPA family protein
MVMVCRKLRIQDIVEGTWDEEDREITTAYGRVDEVRACGTVMDKVITEDGKYAYIILDDGTETIRLKTWRDDVARLDGVERGDIVDVIGRLNHYNEEIYISPKIIKKISYNFWLLRHLEIIDMVKTLPKQPIKKHEKKEDNREEREREPRMEPADEIAIMDTDETAEKIFEIIERETLSREEIIEQTSLDEIDVELALRELLDEEKIKEKDGKFTAVSPQ